MRTQSLGRCPCLVLPIHSTSVLLCLDSGEQDLALPVEKQDQEAGDLHTCRAGANCEWLCGRSKMKDPKRR